MKKVIWTILGLVVVVLVGVGARYFLAYNGFLDKITARKPEMKQYSVVVLDDSELKEFADLEGKSVGFLKIDPKAANASEKLKNEIKVDVDFYEDMDLLGCFGCYEVFCLCGCRIGRFR